MFFSQILKLSEIDQLFVYHSDYFLSYFFAIHVVSYSGTALKKVVHSDRTLY